ncbi:hypothetical protein D3C72_1461250 [compost metagenome]
MVAQGGGFVEDLGAFALRLLQQVGRVEVLAVKRWVLAHDDGIKAGQLGPAVLGFVKPGRFVAGQQDVAHAGSDFFSTDPVHVLRLAGADAVSPCLGTAHHGKGAVLVDLEGFERVGNKEDMHGVTGCLTTATILSIAACAHWMGASGQNNQ